VYGILVLEDGTIIRGKGFGAEAEVLGELVFNTSMTGYVEILTDPSYNGQIVTMTYPLEGNYGVDKRWFESEGIKAEGFIVKDMTGIELDSFLKEYGVPGISDVDTRFITKKIRSKGVVKSLLKTSATEISEEEEKELVNKVRNYEDISDIDLVPEVSTKKVVKYPAKDEKISCVVIDCGVKQSILNCLLERGCSVVKVPYDTKEEEILSYNPDFVLVSNGPGDPEKMLETANTVKNLFGKLPVTGICLGHQIITIALGGKTYKLKFGHRGGNQPVKDSSTGKVYITSQNHGFATDMSNVPEGSILSHVNLNDDTVEGISKIMDSDNVKGVVWSVQHHPEAGPGPHDAMFLFDDMVALGMKFKQEKTSKR
jgi:carbamoyl-phosphate synthase small subunit